MYIKDRAIAFAESGGRVFFVGGQSGCGKTHICTALATCLINRGKSTRYMLWTSEAAKLKACVNDVDYETLIWPLKSVDVLYIDDLFKPTGANSQPTSADIRLAYEIINYRYNIGDKVTIISSERTVSEICDIDEATGGRIMEQAGEYCLNVSHDKAKNWRERNAHI